MNKCPRCENENLKEDYNYCPVCGVNLGTAPEVPVQEQLLKINRNIKFTQCSVIACSLFIILGLNLFLNRFNESIQGITDILNNNVSITGTILDLLQTITNIFVNF